MDLRQAPTTTAGGSSQHNGMSTRLEGHWLVLARIVWIAVVGLILASFVAGIPTFHAFLQSKCTTAACHSFIAPYTAKYFEAAGLSVNYFLIYSYANIVITSLVFLAIGAVLFWLRS